MSAWLWQHACLMRTALERDVGGNHLIREATALAAAGIAFGSRSMKYAGLRLLAGAVGRQILPDGGHEERSPSYHLEVLTDLAEVRSLLPANHPFGDSLGHVLGGMADFAASFCHPDGELPLFNDCSPWPVRVTAFLRALGLEPRPRSRFPESGYYILGTGDTALFFDAGPPSPPDLPPHAHCDLLSFEASVGGRRLLVNSGTADYARGSWRDYWRSTRAHNTVEVDRQEQSEVWHSFRMARRASPSDVEAIETDDGEIVTAAHDGYRRLSPGVVHRRTVARWPPGWVVVDSLEGAGRHTFRSFLHLHPATSHTELHGTHLLERGGSLLRVCPLGGLPVSLVDARREPLENWFAPGLGKREPGRALVMEATVTLPAVFGWVLSIGDHEVRAGIRPVEDGVRVTVQDAGNVRVIDLPRVTGGKWAAPA